MIYYIYKVRRKQTSIHFSRSALPHRYLRYISWISWNGGHRPPQAGFPPVLHTKPQLRDIFAAVPILKAAIARPYLYFHLEDKANILPIFPREKEKHLFSLFSRTFACRSSYVALPAVPRACRPRPICGRSIACPTSFSAALLQTKKCGPTALRREPAKV